MSASTRASTTDAHAGQAVIITKRGKSYEALVTIEALPDTVTLAGVLAGPFASPPPR